MAKAGIDDIFENTPSRVVAVYAHPDDAEVSCGGTLARWAKRGAEVHLVIVAQGDKGSNDPGVEPRALIAERASEVTASAGIMALSSCESLGVPDGEVDNTLELRRLLVAIVRRRKPDVVLCPDPTAVFFGDGYVNHRDHREVGWATLDAVAPAASSRLYFPDSGEPHAVATMLLSGTLEPDVWVDIAESLDTKVRALSTHRTQLGEDTSWAHEFLRLRAVEAGQAAGLKLAEGFRRLRLVR